MPKRRIQLQVSEWLEIRDERLEMTAPARTSFKINCNVSRFVYTNFRKLEAFHGAKYVCFSFSFIEFKDFPGKT